MMPDYAAQTVRREFLAFFEKREHTFVPAAPLVPLEDPTLMFTNAGMNQFKDVFLATGSRPYRRAVNSQKCIRVSGKHNDLEEVGRDTYHHTLFEMLGNWSFDDYFKREAIQWAWELLTEVWGLDKSRLWATVYAGDPAHGVDPDLEAERLWTEITDIDPAHVRRFVKDNFWEMGATGPCGPCSEIHIDLTPDCSGEKLLNAGDSRMIEIWNLVFIQYNRDEAGKLTPLPATHVDTGLGLERIVRVLQGKESNYDTDLFEPLLRHIGEITGERYTGRVGVGGEIDNAFRVIADHTRMLTFAITDGAQPSNEGRGYVVRRILRRAARFGRQYLGQTGPFIYRLVPAVVESLGEAFPEIAENPQRVAEIIREEEASFGRTLDRGLVIFEEAAEEAKAVGEVDGKATIEGRAAFSLYDTYGFPIDLTQQMAEEAGLAVDVEGFNKLMDDARERARASAKKHVELAFDGELPATDETPKYEGRQCDATVLGWLKENRLVASGSLAAADGEVGLVLDRTCFYGEQGGQIGDSGTILADGARFVVDDTQRIGDGIAHVGHVAEGQIAVGASAGLEVDAKRDHTRRHHTATHLLHWALCEVLGDHVTQRGSLVEPKRLRFDFDHHNPVTPEQLARIERLVNERIYADLPVTINEMPTDEARKLPGVRAFFGEKYGDTVRVVQIGDGFSREFCGGTHLSRTGEAGFFKVISEEGVAKGVRRVVAVVGEAAVEYVQGLDAASRAVAEKLKTSPDQLPARVAALQDELRTLKKRLSKGVAADLRTRRQELLDAAERIGDTALIVGELLDAPVEQMREAADWLRKQSGSAAVLLGTRGDGKPLLIAAITDDLVKRGVAAGAVIKKIAPRIGGGGGGKPQLAQAGGRNPASLPDALNAGAELLRESLKGM